MLRILYIIYYCLIVVPVFLVATIITALVVIVGCILGGEKIFAYYPGMIWSRLACFLALSPVRVQGRKNLQKGQSYVFVANHQGAFDIFMIYGFLGVPIKWMMKIGLAKIPFVGSACRAAGFIFVDNSSARAAHRSISDAERRLKNGASLVVFPEGSRTSNGKIDRFRKGAFQIANDLNLPIVAITLNGPYYVLPIGSAFVRPHRMEMIIHAPIIIDQNVVAENGNLQELSDQTKAVISSALWDEFK
jgi:1-acyl-sn-glycerol-3-phosphate acyltransferase